MSHFLDASSVFAAERSLLASQVDCRVDEVYSQLHPLTISSLKVMLCASLAP